MIRFVRTYRRDSGSALRSPGPWHILAVSIGDLTWCGKRPGRMVASQHARAEGKLTTDGIAGIEGLPEGRWCIDCQKAVKAGRRRAYKR